MQIQVFHDTETRTIVGSAENQRVLTYDGSTIDQIKGVVMESEFCSQVFIMYITIDCLLICAIVHKQIERSC